MRNKFKILFDVSRKAKANDLYFAIFQGSLLVKKEEDTLRIPSLDDISKLKVKYENEFFLGELEGKSCFAVEIISEIDLLQYFELIPLRGFGEIADEELFLIAGRANQILNWNKNHKFCGKCGCKTENKKDEMAKICPNCNNVIYPVICPAIIVAITKENKLLLAHNKTFKDNMYSLIAGFVEAGEALESAVKREVFEEIGIKIKNITYYNSSPWPFPNSLMVGFFAEYESGEIKVDGEEIVDADWFSKDDFPGLPKKFSIARKLINEFIGKNK